MKRDWTIYSKVFLMLCSFTVFGQGEQNKKPNVLFILVDDLGKHDLSYEGSKFYETPNIDRLSKESTNFCNGYAACQVCSPSRAAIMTGKSPARLKITDWIGASTGEEWRRHGRADKLLPAPYSLNLPKEDVTIAEAFQKEGYSTFFAGKWHLGGEGSHPEDHGFQINVGGNHTGSPMGGYFSPYDNPQLENKEPTENLSIRLAKETASFIKSSQDKPFFAFLSFYAVHGPIQTTEEKWEKYRNKAHMNDIPEQGFALERNLPIRKYQDNPIYAGLVEQMDDAVGLVLEALKASGLDKNTIVVFTSDNGGVASGDSYSTSNFPLRGGKGYQWEGGIKEPYLIKVPWSQTPKEVKTPVIGMDFYPTLLDLCGLNQNGNQHMDGVSLKPLLEKGDISDRALFWHYPHYGNQGGEPSSIIRQGDWKLIHYWENGVDELYNLKEDPMEQNNVYGSFISRGKEMRSTLDDWLKNSDAELPSYDPEFSLEKKAVWQQKIVQSKWPSLEKERMNILQKGWKPNADWWKSQLTKD
ncbi:Arylsulfatase A [Spirosomataceae bacterium TFI 002]|nr:Arylsulfatase A [Spirosomataceae bacterium TFI 002]